MALHHRCDEDRLSPSPRDTRDRPLGRIISTGLLLSVALYFAVGCTLSLEYIDEGQILYPSWMVSTGSVPYRDFRHLYGPAVFWLNGALLHWFGTNVIVVRVALVILKTTTAAVSYLLARRVASRSFALLAGAMLVAVWGAPWWVFNTPYANHYSLALTLGGLLCFFSLPRHFRLACALAGLCFGCAAAFKQTAGAFGLAGFVLFLTLAEDPRASPDLASGPTLPSWLVRAARLLILAGMFLFFAAYLWPRNSLWNVMVVFTPAALTLGIAAVGSLRAPRPGQLAGLWGTGYAIAGTAVPLLAVGIYYGVHGLLSDLFFDLVRGLPQQVRWFTPFPVPTPRALWSLVLLATGVGLVAFGRRRLGSVARHRVETVRRGGIVVAASMLLLAAVVARAPIRDYVSSEAWKGDALALWFAVPLTSVLLTGIWLVRSRWQASSSRAQSRTAVLLVYCNAVTALLLLYPAADFFHVVMALPAFVPLLAFLAERFCRAGQAAAESPAPGRYLSWGVLVALAIWMVAPAVAHLVGTYAASRGGAISLRRATAIRGTQPKFGEVASLVAYLDAELPPQRELLVLSCEQMLYVLSGRRSALDRDEFVFYLVGAGIISDEDARALVDQRDAVARLADVRPVVVEGGDSPAHDRLREVFPEVSRYIDAHYDTAASVGSYRVLTWAR
jgi:hypothetical protein